MAGSYDIHWANGAAFQVFKLGSQIEIEGSVDDGYKDLEVYFDNTNVDASRQKVQAISNDGYTIEIDLDDGNGTRAMMVEWKDSASDTAMLIGEIFVGDPDGAGGFGGEQDSGEPEEDRT